MDPEQLKLKCYLGDELYVGHDGYHVWLYTWNGINVTNEVALDPNVYDMFAMWQSKAQAVLCPPENPPESLDDLPGGNLMIDNPRPLRVMLTEEDFELLVDGQVARKPNDEHVALEIALADVGLLRLRDIVQASIARRSNRSGDGCDLCGDFPAFMLPACHPTAPLRMTMMDDRTVEVRCYDPACNKLVARLHLDPLNLGRVETGNIPE